MIWSLKHDGGPHQRHNKGCRKLKSNIEQNYVETLEASDSGVLHSGVLDFWTFSIIRYSKELNVSD
jgi:hypothetical protein